MGCGCCGDGFAGDVGEVDLGVGGESPRRATLRSARRMRKLAAIFVLMVLCGARARGGEMVLVEPESAPALGGWVVDQQFMDLMGSPYLLAHGLGEPVQDAVMQVELPSPGIYRVWVRTRDWVAPWKAPGAPGKFQVLFDEKPLATVFGTEGAKWHWQDGGTVEVGKTATLALHDLTGFEGRCDAILLCRDEKFIPPNEGSELEALRTELLGWTNEPADGGAFDFVVVGGGIAGTAAAVAAARE